MPYPGLPVPDELALIPAGLSMLETQMAEEAAKSRLGGGEGGDAGSGCNGTQSSSPTNAETASASIRASASSPQGSVALSRLPPGAEAGVSGQQAAEQPRDDLQPHERQQQLMSMRPAGPQKFDRPMDFR